MKNKMPVHKAFLLQACEDYQASAIILAHLQNSGEKTYKESRPLFLSTPFCGAPFFMLLQMSVEKLSKAAYCKARGIAGKLPPKEHDFVLFLEAVLARNPNFKAFRDRHVSTFRFLREELNTRQPSNVRNHMENLEYPWIDNHGHAHCPARHLSLIRKYLNNALNRNIMVYMRDIKELLESFEKIFNRV